MRTLIAVVTAAITALAFAGPAHAQDSLRDVPEAGDALCDEMQNMIDMGQESGQEPFVTLADQGQGFHDQFCSADDGGNDDDGGEDDDGEDDDGEDDDGGGDGDGGDDGEDGQENPFCEPLLQFISGAEEQGAPEEFVAPFQTLADEMGCEADDENNNDDDNGNGNGNGDDGTIGGAGGDGDGTGTGGGTDDGASVLGDTTAGGSDGALPATGGPLGAAGGLGALLLGLAALGRRFVA